LFGIQVVAEAGGALGLEFFDFYRSFCRVTLDVIDISPFILEFYFQSPLDVDHSMQEFHLGFSAYYNLDFVNAYIIHDKDMKSCGTSVIDNVIVTSGVTQTWSPVCEYKGFRPHNPTE